MQIVYSSVEVRSEVEIADMAAALGSEELDCSVPASIVQSCSGEKIQKSDIKQMIKMDCTFSHCNQSGFM